MKDYSQIEQYFIDWAQDLVGKASIEKEPFGDEGVVYKLKTIEKYYFLKIKFNSTSSDEYEKLKWFQGKIPVPEVIGFTTHENSKALLMTALLGKNLKVLSTQWHSDKIIENLALILKNFHRVDAHNWPFDSIDQKKVLVHGDACLPNFIFEDDKLSGYIDLGDSHLGNPEIDLAAAIWSLQYNLGPGYGISFLKKFGYENPTEDFVEKLRLQYVAYQKTQGFSLE